MRRTVVTLTSRVLLAGCSGIDPEPAVDTNPPANAGTAQNTASTGSPLQTNEENGAAESSSAPTDQTAEQTIPSPI